MAKLLVHGILCSIAVHIAHDHKAPVGSILIDCITLLLPCAALLYSHWTSNQGIPEGGEGGGSGMKFSVFVPF